MNVAGKLEEQAAIRPAQPAIIETRHGRDQVISYRDLQIRCERAAAMLNRAGLGRGDRVLLLTPMSIDLYVALLALWRIGALATVVDVGGGLTHARRCIVRAKPVGLIGVRRAHLLRWASPGLWRPTHAWTTDAPCPLSRWFHDHRRHEAGHRLIDLPDDAPALLTFTSGSTGAPKGAVRTHGFLLAQLRALQPAVDLTPGEIDLATLPIFALANLASGVTTLIPDADLRRPGEIDADRVREQVRRHRPTRATASPAFFARLIEDGQPLPGFTKLFTGGGPVFPSLLDRLSRACPEARVLAVYGSTEAEPIAELDWATTGPEERRRMAVGGGLLAGTPVQSIELRIMEDRFGEPIGPFTTAEFGAATMLTGRAGEIVVAGEHVLGGYLDGQGEEQTKFRVGGRTWHRTGDAGWLDSAGRLWLLGRASARIEDRLGRMYPFAVECAADGIEGVKRTAMVGWSGRRVLVYEAPAGESARAESELARRMAFADLDRMVRMDRLPLDRRHQAKIDYPALFRRLRRIKTD